MRKIRSIKDLKVGDKFVVASEKVGSHWDSSSLMDGWLGKTMTVKSLKSFELVRYIMAEEDNNSLLGGWSWYSEMIDWEKTEQINNELPEPHKDLLKSGDKVVIYDSKERWVLTEIERFFGKNGIYLPFSDYNDDLIYLLQGKEKTVSEIWRGDELIAKRKEKSEKELEIERIEKEMRKLADDLNKLKK